MMMRKAFTKTFPFLFLLFVTMACSPQKEKSPSRIRQNFAEGWQFRFNTEGAEWENVTLPHTARIEPLVVNDQWQGTALYQKSFELDDVSFKNNFLYFEGVMHEADVWINGQHLFHHVGGYLPFEVDITDAILPGQPNMLEVRVNNEDNPDIPPGKPLKELDFNYYGGIYRNVYLITTNQVYITNAVAADKPASGGVLVRFDDIAAESAKGWVQVHFRNESNVAQWIHFQVKLTNPEGDDLQITSEKILVKSDKDRELSVEFLVKNPRLWSPDQPDLYQLNVVLFANNALMDQWSEKVGIRKIELTDEGFFINGEKLFIRGANRHQEYPYMGYAISDEAQFRDAVKIKNAGFDFVRLSHYPQAEAFMKACDELGLMVMNCIPGWQFNGGEEFIENSLQDCRDMIRRDRNHPSVIFWEVSLNETEMPEAFIEQATQILKTELPFDGIYSAGWVDHLAFDLFIPARQHGQPPDYWNFYKDGKRPVFIAEYGDWEYYAHNAGFNQTQFADLQEEERTSRQLREFGEKRLLQQALNFQEAANSNRRGIATIGDANWVMFDYNRGYADDLEASGISDIFRIPKFVYYFYQSQRPPEILLKNELASGPMVRIASYWTENSPTDVKIYSNCEEVELYLNDKLVSRQQPTKDQYSLHLQHPPFIFQIGVFQPGELRAEGFIANKPVAQHSVITPQSAVALKIDVDLSSTPISQNAADVVFVYASIIDENGTVIPNGDHLVTFLIDGGAELIGENPASAKAGIATILLRTGSFTSPIKIFASAAGLKSAEAELTP
jgi:beta-galactosidase